MARALRRGAFSRDGLIARGLRRPAFLMVDGAPGLDKAIAARPGGSSAARYTSTGVCWRMRPSACMTRSPRITTTISTRLRARRPRPGASLHCASSTVLLPTGRMLVYLHTLPPSQWHSVRTQMRSSDCSRSSNEGSRPRPCCRRPTPPRCCSGRCSLQDRSTCERWMAGRRSPQSPLKSRLTLQPETIPSCFRRLRHTEFQPHSGRHRERDGHIDLSDAAPLAVAKLSDRRHST